MRIDPFILVALAATLVGCVPSHISKENADSFTVMGPRTFTSPGHSDVTEGAQGVAEKHCKNKGMNAVHVKGWFRPFIGNFNEFRCTQSHEQIIQTESVKTAAQTAYGCVRENVISLDDHHSDVRNIAEAVSTVCTKEFRDYISRYLKEKNEIPEYHEAAKIQYLKSRAEKILPFVLSWRKLVASGMRRVKPPAVKEVPDSLFKIRAKKGNAAAPDRLLSNPM